MGRIISPTLVPPGSRVVHTLYPWSASVAARRWTCVDLPPPSGPSNVMKNPPGFPAVSIGWTIPSSIRRGIDAQPPVRLLPGAARGQLVTLDQLMLQPANISILWRQLHHRVGRFGPADALQRFLQRRLGRVGRIELVHPAQSILDLRRG